MISTPYNFVPLNDTVVIPAWRADLINENKNTVYAGKINFTLTAQTPIFTRNGSYDANNPETHDFFNIEGKYMIPSASLRGMFRSICEVLTFSALKQVNDNRYSFRSFGSAGDGKEYRDEFVKIEAKIQHGWLYKEGEEYYVLPAGNEKIKFKDIEGIRESIFGSGRKKRKLSTEIYEEILRNKDYPFDQGGNIIQDGKILVITGNTGSGGKTAKKNQYLFEKYNSIAERNKLLIEKNTFKDFLFSVRHRETDESPEWSYWKKHLKAGRKIPIFFYSNGKVQHFGLTRTYKLPFKKSVFDAIPDIHKSGIDLTDMIFGYVDKANKSALKGRVRFSHAICEEEVSPMREQGLLMGGPKGSYYPYYLEQNEDYDSGKTKTYTTWNSDDAKIAGRKFYPKHHRFNTALAQPPRDANQNMLTKIKPLPKDTVFRASISFQQLNIVELGALMSTLTLHHNHKNHFFNIGMAKSMGFGKVKLEPDFENATKISKDEVFNSMRVFQYYMQEQLDGEWINSKQLEELFALCSGAALTEHYGGTNPTYSYPAIKNPAIRNPRDKNDFEKAIKSSKRILPRYSKLTKSQQSPFGVKGVTNSFSTGIEKTPMEEIELLKREYEETIFEQTKATNTIAVYQEFLKKYPDSQFKENIKERLNQLEKEKEKEAFEHAKAANTFVAYQDFVKMYPNSQFKKTVQERLEGLEFQQAQSTNTLKAYEAFIAQFPKSTFVASARQQMNKLKASSGIPERLQQLNDWRRFSKETEQWIKKLPNKTLKDEFKNDLYVLVENIAITEFAHKKLSKNWKKQNSYYYKQIAEWFDANTSANLFKKLNE